MYEEIFKKPDQGGKVSRTGLLIMSAGALGITGVSYKVWAHQRYDLEQAMKKMPNKIAMLESDLGARHYAIVRRITAAAITAAMPLTTEELHDHARTGQPAKRLDGFREARHALISDGLIRHDKESDQHTPDEAFVAYLYEHRGTWPQLLQAAHAIDSGFDPEQLRTAYFDGDLRIVSDPSQLNGL